MADKKPDDTEIIDNPVEDDDQGDLHDQPTPSPEPDEPEPSEAPEEDEDEPEPSKAPEPSRRESLRIQQLLEKMKTNQEPNTAPAPDSPLPTGMDYDKELEATPEMIAKLKKDREDYAAARSGQGNKDILKRVESVQWRTLLEIDGPQMEREHPQLDKNSDDFDPALADAMNHMYLNQVGFDPKTGLVDKPDTRYAEFVESHFELAERIAGVKVATSRKNITSQAAKTGLRPDGSKAKSLNLNKMPDEMTDEELDAYLKQAGLAK